MKKTITTIKTDADLADFGNVLVSLDISEPRQIIIQDLKNERSLLQNKLMWAWLTLIKDHVNFIYKCNWEKHNTEHDEPLDEPVLFDSEDLHEKMKRFFLEPKVTQFRDEVIKTYSTKKLTTKQFGEYLEKIEWYCADKLNLILPQPSDEYEIAIGRKSANQRRATS